MENRNMEIPVSEDQIRIDDIKRKIDGEVEIDMHDLERNTMQNIMNLYYDDKIYEAIHLLNGFKQ